MSLLKNIIKKSFIVSILCIYCTGIFNYTIVKSAHLFHHLVTSTLHQHFEHGHVHPHSHDHHHHNHKHSHDHGHTHNHLIDQALEQISQTENGKEEPATPATGYEIRFQDHFAGDLIAGLIGLVHTLQVYQYYNSGMHDRSSLEPPTPPPQVTV